MRETVGFLIANVCRNHRMQAHMQLESLGLHVGQEMFLLRLWERDGLTQTELANELCVQPATIHKMLSRMETAGLVVSRRDVDDNRVSRVYLTERGRALEQPVREVWDRLEAQTLAHLTLEEKVLLRRILLQVFDNLSTER